MRPPNPTRGLGWLLDVIAERIDVAKGWLMDADDVVPGVGVLVLAVLHTLAAALALVALAALVGLAALACP